MEGISAHSAIKLALVNNVGIVPEDQIEEFQEEIHSFYERALDEFAQIQPADNEGMEEALLKSFSDLAKTFFAGGVLWQAEHETASREADFNIGNSDGSPDFTVVVDTVPFISNLVNKGSITFRFALENESESGGI